MTLISSSIGRCQPGRRDDFLALTLEGMKLFERHGARHARLLNATTAGEQSNSYVLSNEFDNQDAYGAFVDELYRDAEMESYLNRVTAPNSPLVIQSRSLAVQIPLDWSGPTDHGSVIEAYVSRVVPGRFQAACDFSAQVFDFLGKRGATNCRMLHLTHAGTLTDALVGSWEFENMRARGAANDAFAIDPAGQQLGGLLMSSDRPVILVSSGIYRDLHM